MQTILITGVNGFLGSHLASQLCSRYTVIGLEISCDNLWRIEGLTIPVYESNETGLTKLFNEHRIDGIIHTATLYGRNDTPKSILFDNNVLAPIRLLEKAIENGLQFFINTDSFFNDGSLNYQYLADYTLSKKHLLEWLHLFQKQIKIVNMKVFHMYGPNDAPGKFIPWLIAQLSQNVAELDLTPGEQTRDFVYIDDVVSAFAVVCDKMSGIEGNYNSFDIGTGSSITLKEFIETARVVLASKTVLNFGKMPYRVGEIMRSEADIRGLRALGWKPINVVQQGIQKIKWIN